jgi:hypothetical protein
MKKYAPVFFVLIFFCIPKSYGQDEFTGGIPVIYATLANANEWPNELYNNIMLGLGVGIPFINDHLFCIEPEARIECSVPLPEPGPILLRMQTGLNLGKFVYVFFLMCADFYTGLSGILMHDFTNTKTVIGISPQIGVTFTVSFWFFSRIQFQYEWYTDQRYNRFVFTGLYGIMLGDL